MNDSIRESEITKAIKSVGKKFDASKFVILMSKFEKEIDTLSAISNELVVSDDDSERKSVDLGTRVKALNKVIDDARMAAKRPYLDFGKDLDSCVRPVQKVLTGIEKAEKAKVSGHRTRLLAAQRAIENKKEKEFSKTQITLGNLKLELGKAPAPITKNVTEKVDTFSAGSANFKTELVPYLDNISKVPTKYLAVDWKLVKEDIKNGVTEIPGMTLKEEVATSFRR